MTQPKGTHALLVAQRAHLGDLLEAIQRCVYFLHASDASLPWPLSGETELRVQPSSSDFSIEFHHITTPET